MAHVVMITGELQGLPFHHQAETVQISGSEWYFSTTILQKMAGMRWPKYKTAFVFFIDH
jgi:hypothetical protein